MREERKERNRRKREREREGERERGRERKEGGRAPVPHLFIQPYKLAASLSRQILSLWIVKMAAHTKRSKVNSKFIMPRPCRISPPEATKQYSLSQH